NIPLLALALFAAAFMGSKVYGNLSTLSDLNWVYDNTTECSPTDEDCYSEHNGPLNAACDEDEDVCGIVAPPQDPNASIKKPMIDATLEGLINTADPSTGQVFLGPRSNQ